MRALASIVRLLDSAFFRFSGPRTSAPGATGLAALRVALRAALLGALLCVLLAAPALAQAAVEPPDSAALQRAVAAAAEAGFSGAVLVVHAGRTVLEQGVGLAQRDPDVAVTPETVFDIGSVSKELTRALVLELAARGQLRLDQRIAELLPGVPPDKSAITVEQVLEHRAGLAEYVDREGEQGDFTPLTRDQALERILSDPLLFAAGVDEAYSNAGYTLLAIVVETVAGKPFQQVLREAILEPAGMTSTGFYRHGWAPERVAHGSGGRRFGDVNSPSSWPEPAWALIGNGGMVASAGDLARWHRAVVEGRVLSPAAREGLVPRLRPERLSMVAGANDFGFCAFIARLPVDTQIYVLGSSGMERSRDLARALTEAAGGVLPARPAAEQESSDAGPPDFPGSPTGQRLREIYEALDPARDLAAFLEASTTPGFLASYSPEQHLQLWGEVRNLLGPRPALDGLRRTGPNSALMVLRGPSGETLTFTVELEADAPHRIAKILVE
jgi:CubicO group peptidase (beta-lactamase class C family)